MITLTEQQAAIVKLLALPDPPDLPRRAHTYRYVEPVGRAWEMKQQAVLSWLGEREHQRVREVEYV